MPPVAVGFRETNMMSFENSRGYLKHGNLEADDGTLLGIDGTLVARRGYCNGPLVYDREDY